MGSPLQEIFQGRGDKKRQGYWIKRGIPLFFIISTWLGLIIDFPVSRPVLWFSLSVATILIYSALHFSEQRTEFSVEFLFSLALIVAGIVDATHFSWLKLVFFPFIVIITAFYSLRTIIPLSLLIPFLEFKTFLSRAGVVEEAAFSTLIVLTAVISVILLNSLRKEKEQAVASLQTLRDKAMNISHDTPMEFPGDEKMLSHYFASMLKTDEEIRELLITLKQAVFADSVHLFTPQDDSFILRCTTEEKGDIILSGKGVLSDCIKEKKVFSSGEIQEKAFEPGYIKSGKISSIIVSPVLDGSTPVGVLTVDSSRYQAFSEPDKQVVQMFSGHIVRSFRRERIYPKLKRDYDGLRILNDASTRLLSSLHIDVIGEQLCKGAGNIASSSVFFFIARGKRFELIRHTGNSEEKKKLFDFRGSVAQMAIENRQTMYLSDVTDYSIPVLPLKTGTVRSVILIPLQYENDLLGLFVMLSDKTDFLDTFQSELLKLMCNQASTSIVNAKLHGEIERLATTDGLTGLFNHRLFQEKLTAELRRQKRFSEQTSLILTDIDHFKNINDSYGHPVGDLVLKGVAKILKETIRDIDIPARYGGEEFAAILPGTDSEGAIKIAERLRKTVMNRTFSADGTSFKITVSIGIATAPVDAQQKEELIEKADRALYHAKHQGRNRSVLWSHTE